MDNRVAYITNNGVLCNKEERNLNSLASKIHLAFGLCAIAIACVVKDANIVAEWPLYRYGFRNGG
jgi:hypothetical protein